MKEYDVVVLVDDLPEYGLRKGDTGTIVITLDGGAAYMVEFAALEGKTVPVVTLTAEQLRPVA